MSTKRTTRHVPTSLSASPPANAIDEGGINIAAPVSTKREIATLWPQKTRCSMLFLLIIGSQLRL
jgi:hypothetical protein